MGAVRLGFTLRPPLRDPRPKGGDPRPPDEEEPTGDGPEPTTSAGEDPCSEGYVPPAEHPCAELAADEGEEREHWLCVNTLGYEQQGDIVCCPQLPHADLPHTGTTGIAGWRFEIAHDPGEGGTPTDYLAAERDTKGTVSQQLRDAQLLGVHHIRNMEEGDAWLDSAWVGRLSPYAGPDGAGNSWGDEEGWPRGVPVTPTTSCWYSGERCHFLPREGAPVEPVCTDDLPGPLYPGIDAPPVAVDPLADIVLASKTRSIVPVPILLGKSNRDDGAYAWRFVDEAKVLGQAAFELFGVEDRFLADGSYNSIYLSTEHLQREFIRQLFTGGANPLTYEWRRTGGLPFVQLGNELDAPLCPSKVAWLVLHLSELLEECAPGVLRVYPGLGGASNQGHESCPSYYIESVMRQLDLVFYHIVRSALIVRVEDPVANNRFEDVLPGIELAWDETDGGSLKALLAQPIDEGGCGRELDDPSVMLVHIVPLPESEGEMYECLQTVKAWSRAHLRAPFHIMDFHWFAARHNLATGGSFLPLSASKPYVQALRHALEQWWQNGSEIGIWCGATGLASHATPQHYEEGGVALSDGEEVDCYTCFAHFDQRVAGAVNADRIYSRAELELPGGMRVPASTDLEFRYDPVLAEERFDTPDRKVWPDWVFTSELEQARQVWMRLSYFAGLGVRKVFWFSNDVTPTGQEGEGAQKFYSYGLTDDTVASAWDTTICMEASQCTCAENAALLEAGEAPDPFHTAKCVLSPQATYSTRRKKLGFCAMRQWNRYLDHYRAAVLVPGLDGIVDEGFYAVLFRRSPESERGVEFPYAIVAWADYQGYRPTTPGDDVTLEPRFRPVDLSWVPLHPADGCSSVAVQVATVPGAEESGTPDPICNPCLDDGEAPAPGTDDDYRGGRVFRFGPEVEFDPCAEPIVARIGDDPDYDADPVLILLKEGKLRVNGGAEYGIQALLSGAAAEVYVPPAPACTLEDPSC